uniref:Ig-like domain-containing protein n=1 Tax=Chrysemys picta bellii TaxID=8478 RepID=A0A8C3FAR5_CHRPI
MHNVVSQGCHRDFLRGRCSLSFNVILDVALFPGANEAVRCERVPAAALGEDVTLKCNFTHSLDVLQVTWQKLEGSSFKNIATYSKAHGTKFIGPFNKRIYFNDTSLKASSITLRGVTLEDETCYKCIFNAFPYGSFGRETCLIVQCEF